MTEKYVIKTQDLTVAYEEEPVLLETTMQMPKGKMTAIIGPNGAGKSTLLESLLNFIQPIKGQVEYYGGQTYDEVKDNISYVPQKQAVDWNFPATVLDVVLMGRYGKVGLFKRLSKKDKQIALDQLEAVEMGEFVNRQINQLSGGQKQRVFLARALASSADIFLLDEPLAGVDMKTEKIIMSLLKQLTTEGKTVVVVHHDLQTIREYFDYVVFLNKSTIAQGSVQEAFHDENIKATFRPTSIKDVEPNVE